MRGVPALVVLGLLAGCLSAAPATEVAPSGTETAPAFSFSAEGCEASGFTSSYGVLGRTATLAVVWKTADIREEIGNPLHDGMGMPVVGPLSGNWHIGTRCASAIGPDGAVVEDFTWGWVGQMVEPPEWDVGGADLHFLLTGLALENGTVADGLRNATTVDVTHAWDIRTEWLLPKDLPRSAVYTHFADVERGVYQSWSNLHVYRDLPDRVVRFWWQVPADGSEASSGHHHDSGVLHDDTNPVYFDLSVSGGPHRLTPPVDAVEAGSHNMLRMEHGPVLFQTMVTHVYDQPSLTFAYGRVFDDVVLHEIWTH